MTRSISIAARFLLIAVIFSSLSACGVSKAATAITAGIVQKGISEVEAENDLYIAKGSIVPLIKIIEVLHRGNPANITFLSVLTQACGNYAFGFAEPIALADGKDAAEWQHRALAFYKKGMDYGISALSQNRAFKKALSADVESFEKMLRKIGKSDTSLLFWTAFNWGSIINLSKDDPTAIINLPKVEAMVARVIELDPNFSYGMAKGYKGVFFASRPPMFGGDPKQAEVFFSDALKISDGKYLMIKVLMAEWYAVRIQDRALFTRLLNEVLASPDGLMPEQSLANNLAKERAGLLMKRESKYF